MKEPFRMSARRRRTSRFSAAPAITLLAVALLAQACAASPTLEGPFTVGILNLTPSLDPVLAGFKDGMAGLGYVEGQSIIYQYEGPVGTIDKLDEAAQRLVAADVDLILSITTPATQAAQRATVGLDIPVVFAPVTDPVAAGIVGSLKSPGGNITGITTGGSEERRLQWHVDLLPTTRRVFVPYNPDGSSNASLAVTQAAAGKLGIELVTQVATTAEEVLAATQAIPEGMDGIFILSDGFMESQVDKWIPAAIEHGLPLSSTNLDLVGKGLLFSFGHRPYELGRQLARLADQLLHGARPADLPVETAEFFLAINLHTADAIALEIPDTILRQADDILR
jgi:putative ABC transport system substrate-binding protein